MSDVRTPMDEMPEHLRMPFKEVVASHAGPKGILHELEDGRFLDPSYVLLFAREHGRNPTQEEYTALVKEHARATKREARYSVQES